MVFIGQRSAVCFQQDSGNYHVSAATYKPAPVAKTKVILFRIFLFSRSMFDTQVSALTDLVTV